MKMGGGQIKLGQVLLQVARLGCEGAIMWWARCKCELWVG